MDKNLLNFSGGPGVLPQSVLAEVQEAIAAVPGVGLSVLGISHRSDWFEQVLRETEENIRRLLGLPDSYAVLFLQGGATLQFSMVPMLLLRDSGKVAEYLHTGYWSGKSIPEAAREGAVNVLWSGGACAYARLPDDAELACSADAAYFHYVSNETVEGVQFHRVMGRDGVPRVCDMSSDFLSRPIAADRYDLIYAHAQKNVGPAGVTVVVARRALLERSSADLPALLDYRNHLNAHSNYNTPPVFAIYVVMLVTRWLLNEVGGLERMAEINRRKADLLYALLDDGDSCYRAHAAVADRSLMNVVFRLDTPEREREFLAAATAAGFSGLAGHRSLGGVRASVYNAMTLAAVEYLRDFMIDFAHRSAGRRLLA